MRQEETAAAGHGEQGDSRRLVRVADTDLRIADWEQDIRGWRVIDREGKDLGRVSGLFIDERERKVRFIEVGSGGILGIGESHFLLPVDAITRLLEEKVYVNQDRERVAGAPKYNPDLSVDTGLDDYYAYYGYPPYWTSGYAYPSLWI